MFLVSGCNLLGNFGHSGGFKVPYVVLALVILEGDSVLRNRAGHHHSPYAHIDSILTIWAVNPSEGSTSKVEEWRRVLKEGIKQGELNQRIPPPHKVLGSIYADTCSSASSTVFMRSTNSLVLLLHACHSVTLPLGYMRRQKQHSLIHGSSVPAFSSSKSFSTC